MAHYMIHDKGKTFESVLSSPDTKTITSLREAGLYCNVVTKCVSKYKHYDIRKNIDQGNLAQIEIVFP